MLPREIEEHPQVVKAAATHRRAADSALSAGKALQAARNALAALSGRQELFEEKKARMQVAKAKAYDAVHGTKREAEESARVEAERQECLQLSVARAEAGTAATAAVEQANLEYEAAQTIEVNTRTALARVLAQAAEGELPNTVRTLCAEAARLADLAVDIRDAINARDWMSPVLDQITVKVEGLHRALGNHKDAESGCLVIKRT